MRNNATKWRNLLFSVTDMQIDKADYALLYAVSEDEWLAYLLAGDVGMESIMNKPSHGLGVEELAEHFFRLWKNGLIECSVEESGPPFPLDFDLVRQQFVRTEDWPPQGDRALFYRLTPAGGELWEEFAEPDWNKFFYSCAGATPDEWTLTATNRALIELSLGCGGYIFPLPVPGTERWDTVQPGQATYWKTVPKAVRLTFRHENQSHEINESRLRADMEFAAVRRTWCQSFEQVCRRHF
jgi:hypothetical protein